MKKFLIFALIMAVIGNEVKDYGMSIVGNAVAKKQAILANT